MSWVGLFKAKNILAFFIGMPLCFRMLNITHVVYTEYGTKHSNLNICLQNVLARKKGLFIGFPDTRSLQKTPQTVTEVSRRISILNSNKYFFYHVTFSENLQVNMI